MKIVIINHSDTLGGASVVSMRLMEALRKSGHDARMLVSRKLSDNPYVEECGRNLRGKFCFLAEHARIYMSCGFNRRNLFKISIANVGLPLSQHHLVRNADVVMLNWVNQGMLSLREIGRIAASKPVIWTMHDMWCMTGVCHHAGYCLRFGGQCGYCPLIRKGASFKDLSRNTWLRKHELNSRYSIHYVAVSRWLAARAKESSLLSGAHVEVIPNAFPTEEFPAARKRTPGIMRIVMGAARLDDPIKNLPAAIEALNIVAEKRPDGIEAVFFGEIRDPSLLERLRMPFRHLGTVRDTPTLARLYGDSKVVLSTSLYETLPGTVIEGMSAGCVAVTTDAGGQADIVDHLQTGYIAHSGDVEDIAQGILWALDADIEPMQQHSAIERKFSSHNVAMKYVELINDIIK